MVSKLELSESLDFVGRAKTVSSVGSFFFKKTSVLFGLWMGKNL